MANATAEKMRRPATRLRAEIDQLRAALPEYPRRYLYLLMVVTAIDASDRTLLPTVFEDVKRAFDISDTQLGVLTSAFLVVATFSAVPFGFLADRMSRVRLIALGFVPWSLAMFWSAAAGSFGMLLTSRLFLGSIEATNGPATPSLLGDYYPASERSRVYGVFTIGGQLGSIIGFVLGGTLATALGWREAFVVIGLIGLVTGFVVSRLPEPARGLPDALHRAEQELAEIEAAIEMKGADLDSDGDAEHVDLRTLTSRQALGRVLRVPTMWVLAASSTVSLFFTSSLGVWLPTYFRRYHGMSAAAAGGLLAVLTIFLIAGIVVGGRHGDRAMVRWGPRSRILIIAVCLAGQFPAWLGLFTTGSLLAGVACIAVVAVFTGYPLGIATAAFLEVYPSHLRGRAAGVQTILRVVATAAAPVVFGVLSDLYGLRSAWLYTLPALLVAAAITLIALRTYPPDLLDAQVASLRQHRLEREESEEAEKDGRASGGERHGSLPPSAPLAMAPSTALDTIPPYTPPPVSPKPAVSERFADLARDARATPRRAALMVLSAIALVALVVSAIPVGAEAVDGSEAVTAKCGIDTVMFGHPDAAAEQLCRDAMVGRSVVFFAALAVLLIGLVGLARLVRDRSRREGGRIAALVDAVSARPHRVVVAAATVLAAVVVAVSSRSVPVELGDSGLSARCGVDTVLLGHPIGAVEDACRDVASTQTWVFVVALLVLLVGLGGLLRILVTMPGRLAQIWSNARTRALLVSLVASCAVAAIAGLSALRPVSVEVTDPAGGTRSLLVSCGVDTVIGGHPIAAVERSCRDELAARGPTIAGAALAFGVGAAGLLMIRRHSRRPDWRFT